MQHKIWYKNSDPTVIISVNKTVGDADETSFMSDTWPDDQEFYTINHDADPVLVRKVQSAIDAIKAARAQATADKLQKKQDAKAALTINDLAGKTYQQADDYVETQVTDLARVKAMLKKMAKIILAMLKERDFSD